MKPDTKTAHTPWTMNGDDDDWRCPENENASVSGSATIYDARGSVVAFAVTTGWSNCDAKRRDIIIRAVNCHEELLTALKNLLATHQPDPSGWHKTEAAHDVRNAAYARARDAIALAEGNAK